MCGCVLQELYSHYTQQVKDTCASLADPHKAYLLRKAMHYFNTQRQHRQEASAHDKPLIEVWSSNLVLPGRGPGATPELTNSHFKSTNHPVALLLGQPHSDCCVYTQNTAPGWLVVHTCGAIHVTSVHRVICLQLCTCHPDYRLPACRTSLQTTSPRAYSSARCWPTSWRMRATCTASALPTITWTTPRAQTSCARWRHSGTCS